MNIIKSKIKLLSAAALIIMASCNKQLNPLLNDPSKPTAAAADNDLYLNNLQLAFRGFYQTASDIGDQVVRYEAMFGPTYYNAFTASSFDGLWGGAYQSIFLTANTMIPLAEAKGQFIHAGIAQALKAYTMITMVDYFGDIPYSEADKGKDNTNPKTDPGKQVYDSAIALLDSAIANFAKTSSIAPINDLFYGVADQQIERASWTKLAKTLKLKAYLQERLVDMTVGAKIAALITEDDLIKTIGDDFAFSYGTKDVTPDSRHPHYSGNYGANTGVGDYLGTYFLWSLVQEKGMWDPRARYYLYRQIDTLIVGWDNRIKDKTTTQFAIPCLYRVTPYSPGTCYCTVTPGYLGRDHGNNEGAAPDGFLRTTWGVYPVGGEFDANQNAPAGTDRSKGQTKGGPGNGINPIWLSSFTNFLKAEAALTLGTGGDARALLDSAVRQSFEKVAGFNSVIGYGISTDTNYLITPYKQKKYMDYIMSKYDVADAAGKLEIVEKEYYLAAWGNGIEPYNNYRRTGKPSNMQPLLGGNATDFIRSFFYASVYVNFNKNAAQKTGTGTQVFWDNNPADFLH